MDKSDNAVQSIDNDELIYQGIRNTLAGARVKVYTTVRSAMVEAYWDIGRQIEKAVGKRAEYGKGLLQYLARQLTAEFGKGFDESSLRRMRQFYNTFPIRATLSHELSWSHYCLLMKIGDVSRREFYVRECVEAAWSVRQLERQINSFFMSVYLLHKRVGVIMYEERFKSLSQRQSLIIFSKIPIFWSFWI